MKACKKKLSLIFLITTNLTFGFEHTGVIPKGVRNFKIKNVYSVLSEKFSSTGSTTKLSSPLEKEIIFHDIAKEKTGYDGFFLQSMLKANNFNLTDSLGNFTADMKGNVSVTAALFSYGVTDNFTLALVLPYYQAKMNVSIGFEPSEKGKGFVGELESSSQTKSAKEAANKLNSAPSMLQDKLSKSGYKRLTNWTKSGLGDSVLAGKLRMYNGDILKIANQTMISFPTGKFRDPDMLNDIPFGSGSLAISSSLVFDEYLREDLFLNEYAKIKVSQETTKEIRQKTNNEKVFVPKESIAMEEGELLEVGSSIQYAPSFGLVAGLGYAFETKAANRYYAKDKETNEALSRDTFEKNHNIELNLGYSSLPAFKRKEIMVPFVVDVEYRNMFMGLNSVKKDLLSFNVSLFF